MKPRPNSTIRRFPLVLAVATAFAAAIFALFFDWRGRIVRRLRTEQDVHGASDIAHTRR